MDIARGVVFRYGTILAHHGCFSDVSLVVHGLDRVPREVGVTRRHLAFTLEQRLPLCLVLLLNKNCLCMVHLCIGCLLLMVIDAQTAPSSQHPRFLRYRNWHHCCPSHSFCKILRSETALHSQRPIRLYLLDIVVRLEQNSEHVGPRYVLVRIKNADL